MTQTISLKLAVIECINKKINMFERVVLLILSMLVMSTVYAQENSPSPTTEADAEVKYAKNIKKSRINGVYIPKDHFEAIKELKEISPESSLAKFRAKSEEIVIKKLHFGLGRWIRYNWNFYEGSRLGEHLKGMGVSHPDDMSTFLMMLLHRELNGAPLMEKEIIAKLSEERKKLNGINRDVTTIKTTPIPKNGGK